MHLLSRSLRLAAGTAAVALPLASALAQGGAGARRPLTQADYDGWRSITGTVLSRDGQWLAYSLQPQVGDGELVVRATGAATEWRIPRGFIGRPVVSVTVDSPFVAPPAQFSADGRALAALVYAPKADFDRAARARRPGTPAPAQPRASLAIVSLPDGKVTTVPRVRSFSMPRETGGWLAYLLEPGEGSGAADSTQRPAPGAAAAAPGGQARPVSGDSTRRGGRRPEVGSTLVVRDLASGAETRVEDVTTFQLADSGRWLAYTTASRGNTHDGVFVRALGPQGLGNEVALASGRGSYRGLAFDRGGRQVAFVTDRDEATAAKPRFALYHARLGGGTPTARAVVTPAALTGAVQLSERGVTFTRDGSTLVFGVAPVAPDSIPADSLADKAVFDLWHYQEARLQPQQRLEAGRDRARAYTAVYHVATSKWTQLGGDSLPNVQVSEDGSKALAVTNVPYALAGLWGEDGSDVVLLDARSGARRVVARKVPFGAQLSPAARYVVWFAEKRWHAFDTQTGKTADLTGGLAGVRFDQETWDTPSEPAPWGVAGWTPGERSVLLYSQYDIWEVDPAGARPARVVTDSAGARGSIQFRLAEGGGGRRGGGRGGAADDRYVDPAQPVLLTAFDDKTKQAGFWRDRIGVVAAPERILMADARFGAPVKAANAEVYAVTRQTFTEFPDVWVGSKLDALTKVTNANPQQGQYAWGSAELVEWMHADGLPLQGVLYKPANFDPAKKYPMIVYYYEKLSDNLHQYHAPFGRNTINPTVFASNGYVVFFPDIAYTTGYPGQSALKSIVPGVQSLIAKGFVNPKGLGIAGQSWGGYQSAYIITQTPLFAAAFLGAPVANMTSAYGGIRWESGRARAFQYEKGQSRIGESLWEAPFRYIENSPLFYVDRVQTPSLIMANDADGAVPWYQGIELFVGLRRFGKETYLINYNGDAHNPRKRANQLDMDRRMQQFFGHKLKGEPAPEWMEKGIPFLQKGRDQLAPPSVAAPAMGAAQPQPSAPIIPNR